MTKIVVKGTKRPFKTQKAIREELISVLRVALYDLALLNRHDPLQTPRCLHRAEIVLAACGVDKIAVPNFPPITTAQEIMPDLLGLLNALLDEKLPVHRLPRTSFHASNLLTYLKTRGVDVLQKRADAARSSEKKTKVSKARKKVRPKSRSSKPKKRTRRTN